MPPLPPPLCEKRVAQQVSQIGARKSGVMPALDSLQAVHSHHNPKGPPHLQENGT